MNSSNPITIAAFVVVTIFLLGAWVLFSQDESYEAKLVELAANENKWKAVKPESFEYEAANGCMFVHKYKIEHRNGRDIKKTTGNELAGTDTNIDGLFYKADKAIRKSYRADIKYHPHFGFPVLIDVDWDKDIIDDECFFEVTSFKVSNGSEI